MGHLQQLWSCASVVFGSLVIFPPIAAVGIPLTLAGLSRHRTKSPRLFGWSVACGTTALISVIIATLVIAGCDSGTIVYSIDIDLEFWANPAGGGARHVGASVSKLFDRSSIRTHRSDDNGSVLLVLGDG